MRGGLGRNTKQPIKARAAEAEATSQSQETTPVLQASQCIAMHRRQKTLLARASIAIRWIRAVCGSVCICSLKVQELTHVLREVVVTVLAVYNDSSSVITGASSVPKGTTRQANRNWSLIVLIPGLLRADLHKV